MAKRLSPMWLRPEKRIRRNQIERKNYDLNKLAKDIKLIKESLAKQEPGAKGFTESQGAAKNEEAKTVIRGNFREFLKDESKKSWVPSEVFPRQLMTLGIFLRLRCWRLRLNNISRAFMIRCFWLCSGWQLGFLWSFICMVTQLCPKTCTLKWFPMAS